MSASNRAVACCLALGCIFILLVSFIPDRVLARETRNGDAAIEEYVMVGGEPGEDPHLRTKTDIRFVDEPAGSAGPGGAAARGSDTYSYDLNGCGGGQRFYVGSRVDWVRRALLQALLWTMHQ